MRSCVALVALIALSAGCAMGPAETPAPETPAPETPAPESPSPTAPTTPPATPGATPAPPAPRPPHPRVVVTNGMLDEMRIDASTTYEIVFLLNATDRVRVNLNFGAMLRPAPYGWSGQVSIRAPDGRLAADSGTSMPEGGASFSLLLRDLARSPDAGPGEFLARVHTSHPTTLTAFTYVDEAAGGS